MLNLNAHVLRILAGCPDSGIAVPYLRTEAGLAMGRKCGDAELHAAITDLKQRDLITDGEPSLTNDPRVKLTAKGRKEAAKL